MYLKMSSGNGGHFVSASICSQSSQAPWDFRDFVRHLDEKLIGNPESPRNLDENMPDFSISNVPVDGIVPQFIS